MIERDRIVLRDHTPQFHHFKFYFILINYRISTTFPYLLLKKQRIPSSFFSFLLHPQRKKIKFYTTKLKLILHVSTPNNLIGGGKQATNSPFFFFFFFFFCRVYCWDHILDKVVVVVVLHLPSPKESRKLKFLIIGQWIVFKATVMFKFRHHFGMHT